jgi:predicted nuclease with TOPRIM domain
MRIYSVKNGLRYFREQRDNSKTQERWTHYNDEVYRLERKLYELELEEELKLKEHGQTV